MELMILYWVREIQLIIINMLETNLCKIYKVSIILD